jgi:hypothetical protein
MKRAFARRRTLIELTCQQPWLSSSVRGQSPQVEREQQDFFSFAAY